MKNSISLILILLLFSSAQDQNDEELVENIIHQAPLVPEIISSESLRTSPFQSDEKGSSVSALEGNTPESAKSFQNGALEDVRRDVGLDEMDKAPPRTEREWPFNEGQTVELLSSPEAKEDTHAEELHLLQEDSASPKHADVQEPSSNQETEEKGEEKPPSELNKSEDAIPSFSEWTKLQLAQRKEAIINNFKNKTSFLEGKNFASPDCGTKVINSNPESQNPSGVISSSHDEYMLNRCTTNVWFILELCEPLTIERVSIGNLELFSSNPLEIEFGVSDRYPTRDWSVIGPYHAPDSRNMHLFHLPTNNSTFGKYLRVIVKAHHGNEHYCPLSLIKVYGRSEYEVLESETTHGEDMEMEAPGIAEEEMNDDKPLQKSVIGTATAAVMDMVKKAADALVSKKIVEAEDPPLPHLPTPPTNSTCVTLAQCLQESELKATLLRRLSCQSKELAWLQTKVSWCGWENCHRLLEKFCIGSPWMPEGLLIAIYEPTIIESLCHYIKPMAVCEPLEPKDDEAQVVGVGNETGNESLDFPHSRLTGDGVVSRVEAETPGGTEAVHVNTPPTEQQPNFHLTTPPPAEEPAQKESVFVRLSNRIKNLERNQSLSSGYLEELSQRFRKQNEEIHTSHEQFRRTLNESLTKCTLVEQSLRYEVRKLNRNIDSLRELIWRVELQRSGLFLLSILQLVCTCVFWWAGRERRERETSRSPTSTSTSTTGLAPHELRALPLTNQRKRSYSQPPKQKKKKKRKEVSGGGRGEPILEKSPSSKDAFEISTSLSSSSTTPLRLPPSPPFQFKPPLFFHASQALTQHSCMLPTTPHGTGRIQPGISTSDMSETSFDSTLSRKKKSKLKAFFFGK